MQTEKHVLVTGSEGTLGAVVVETLRSTAGLRVTGTDLRAGPRTDLVCALADLGDRAADLAGVDTVVHLASLHGRDHMTVFGADDFWRVNVDGTRAVYATAARMGARHVVLAGSMAMYGPVPVAGMPWAVVTEDAPTRSYDPYSLTKKVGEDIAGFHATVDGVVTTALRFGHFTPADVDHYGFRLLFGGVDVRDAAAAVAAAVARPHDAGVRGLNVHARSPLLPGDVAALDGDLLGTARARCGREFAALEGLGIDPVPLLWGRGLWPIDRAERDLSWRPQWDFARYAAARLAGELDDYALLAAPRWGFSPA